MLSIVPRTIARWALLFGLCLHVKETSALTWPLLNYPPGSVVEPMGQRLRHNGYQMQIARFTVDQPAEQVLQFFQSSWKSSKPRRATLDDWHILTKKEGDFITTIEVRPELSNRVQGVAAIRFTQDVHTLEQGVPKDIPIGNGFRIASLLESEDYGRRAVTIMLIASGTPSHIHKFYKRELTMRGWAARESQQASSTPSVNTLFISKANRRGMVHTTHAGGMTQSVIHIDHEN